MLRGKTELPTSRTTPGDITDPIVAQTSLGSWALDGDDRTIWVNPQMAELAGSTPEEMLGRPVYDFLDPLSAEATRVALGRRRSGVSELREVELHRGDGSVVQALVEPLPLLRPE